MQRTPPRHLAPPVRVRTRARDHLLVESILAMVAIVLTTAIVIGALLDRQESSAARLPNLLPPAPTTTRAAAATSPATPAAPPASGANPLGNLGFEAGMGGWRPLGGAGLERVGDAREGAWAAAVSRGSARVPGLTFGSILEVRTHHVYHGTVWVRASQPQTTVQVNLFEVLGGKRFAVDTVGAVVGGRWQRLEVAHEGHRAGATLAAEVLAPDLSGGSRLVVDDLAIKARSGTSITGHP
jgi:hypothetical protein